MLYVYRVARLSQLRGASCGTLGRAASCAYSSSAPVALDDGYGEPSSGQEPAHTQPSSSTAWTGGSRLPAKGPSLHDFLRRSAETARPAHPAAAAAAASTASSSSSSSSPSAASRKVHIETYGCQMNSNDSEVVLAVLAAAGYAHTPDPMAADVVLLNTCAIRENAESKVWQRLGYYKNQRAAARRRLGRPQVVGVLGCMAERLRHQLLESGKLADLVAGPDAYRDLPRLIDIVQGEGLGSAGEEEVQVQVQGGAAGGSGAAAGKASSGGSSGRGSRGGGAASARHGPAINVQLSAEETYADIVPLRQPYATSAFLSIMRGCNNMCAFCIVPYTRGRERSRPMESILEEVRMLSDQGVKEVTLLGQNVNSYADASQAKQRLAAAAAASSSSSASDPFAVYAKGFRSVYKPRRDGAVSFAELLDRVAEVDPEMRIRFTSPHPKDFSDEVLQVIATRPNVCKQLHMPAQSGSSAVLERMRRGYTREAYDELVAHVREAIPAVSLSTDIITGFCGETEEEHAATVDLMRLTGYDQAFMFAYSDREKTYAAKHLQDDVSEEVKNRRLQEVIAAFREVLHGRCQEEVGRRHLVLVEGGSRRSDADLTGRTDTFKRVVFPDAAIPTSYASALAAEAAAAAAATAAGGGWGQHRSGRSGMAAGGPAAGPLVRLQPGDYVAVEVTGATGGSLLARPLARTSIAEFVAVHGTPVPLQLFSTPAPVAGGAQQAGRVEAAAAAVV